MQHQYHPLFNLVTTSEAIRSLYHLEFCISIVDSVLNLGLLMQGAWLNKSMAYAIDASNFFNSMSFQITVPLPIVQGPILRPLPRNSCSSIISRLDSTLLLPGP